MFKLKKVIHISASHKLPPPYKGRCSNLHGHNYKITLYFSVAENELENGMVIDFNEISRLINENLDHKNLNEIIPNPTTENLAKYISELLPRCYKIKIAESEGNVITYYPIGD